MKTAKGGHEVPLATDASAFTVLVVDDDPVVRRLLSITLAHAGLRVEEACTGREALDLAARRPYALVLLDSNMPGMSGLEVLAGLRAGNATRTVPVVMVTSEDDVGARVHGLQEGADDYVTKPFHPDELVARVRAQLRGRAAWAEVLESRLAERSAITAALCRMHPAATADRTAEVLCDEVRELRHLGGAALVVFPAESMATPLAVRGTIPGGLMPGGLRAGLPLAASAAARLHARARNGPWLDRHDGGPVAWAPFATTAEPLGVLALAGGSTDAKAPGADAELLAAAIDFAAVAARLVTPALLEGGRHDPRRAGLADLLRRQAFMPVFQPIVDLAGGAVIGFEALTRFSDGSPPHLRFAQAAALHRGIELETATLAAALRAASAIAPSCWLSVNVSPALVLEGDVLHGLLRESPLPIVLELTEHDQVDDYGELSSALARLRPAYRLSVDDAGSGFASLRHVLILKPDFVKLDQSWVTGIDEDPARQALVAGLGYFTGRTGSVLIAEGVETEPERTMLTELDVGLAQGYLFGRPAPLPGTD